MRQEDTKHKAVHYVQRIAALVGCHRGAHEAVRRGDRRQAKAKNFDALRDLTFVARVPYD